MKYIDVLTNDDEKLVKRVRKLGFDEIFLLDGNVIKRIDDSKTFELPVYTGNDVEDLIRKNKIKALKLSDSNLILNKGLCSRLKEANAFVIFDLRSLVEKENFFQIYKNFLINGKRCNDYGINGLFVTLADDENKVKSPIQLLSFAKAFGYNEKNFDRSNKNLSKFL